MKLPANENIPAALIDDHCPQAAISVKGFLSSLNSGSPLWTTDFSAVDFHRGLLRQCCGWKQPIPCCQFQQRCDLQRLGPVTVPAAPAHSRRHRSVVQHTDQNSALKTQPGWTRGTAFTLMPLPVQRTSKPLIPAATNVLFPAQDSCGASTVVWSERCLASRKSPELPRRNAKTRWG